MKLYLIGGLGADERVFQFLNLNIETQFINWIEHLPQEDLKSYTNRLKNQINQDEEFGILGVSFGGIIAIEISKLLKPKFIIVLSSVEYSEQLPKFVITIGKKVNFDRIPNIFIKPPKLVLGYLFGAQNKSLLYQIINDTKPEFIKWALKIILEWSNSSNSKEIIRIHGTKDKLIPLKGNAITVENGGHFMIVDRADEISKILNEQLKNTG
jgi:hypothetical protein